MQTEAKAMVHVRNPEGWEMRLKLRREVVLRWKLGPVALSSRPWIPAITFRYPFNYRT
jgi:hypothetical protein